MTRMHNEQTYLRTKQLIAAHLAVRDEEVIDSATLAEDLGADSLDMVELCVELEDEFKVELPDADIEKVLTVDDLIKLVIAKQEGV